LVVRRGRLFPCFPPLLFGLLVCKRFGNAAESIPFAPRKPPRRWRAGRLCTGQANDVRAFDRRRPTSRFVRPSRRGGRHVAFANETRRLFHALPGRVVDILLLIRRGSRLAGMNRPLGPFRLVDGRGRLIVLLSRRHRRLRQRGRLWTFASAVVRTDNAEPAMPGE
jgi:hypothetical protein